MLTEVASIVLANNNARESNPRDRRTEMSEMGIAQLLLRGSKNIDRMKEDVSQVVSMVLGLVPVNLLHSKHQVKKGASWSFYTENGSRWDIRCDWMPYRFYLIAECWVKKMSGDEEITTLEYSSTCPELSNRDKIQDVHEALDGFVWGMQAIFPKELEEQFTPFRRAAKREL